MIHVAAIVPAAAACCSASRRRWRLDLRTPLSSSSRSIFAILYLRHDSPAAEAATQSTKKR
jgi:hypothetical protein